MITYATTDSVEEEDDFRVIKVQEEGTKTPFLFEGFGEDSHPLKGMTALMMDTQADGECAVVGFLDVEKITALGEKRIFSLDLDGNVSSYIWLKNNGKIEFNGNENSLVKYNELKEKCDALEKFINTELPKIQSAIATAGGTYVPAQASFDISSSEAVNLKCE